MQLRRATQGDRAWIGKFWQERWGDAFMIVHGQTFTPETVEGIIAYERDEVVGLVTLSLEPPACEVVTIDSLVEKRGIGTLLMSAAARLARASGCRRLFLVTTNDNLNALQFYQKLGMRLCALRVGAVDEARKLKPSIPWLGENDIPIRDEIELEFDLSQRMPGESELDFE